jgi:hypothetical protein
MSLVLTLAEKNEVEKDIVDVGISELRQSRIKKEELKEIADFTLAQMPFIKTRMDMNKFLEELALKWPIFKEIASMERGEFTKMVENEVYSGALTLLKHGKIDSAIKLTESVVN